MLSLRQTVLIPVVVLVGAYLYLKYPFSDVGIDINDELEENIITAWETIIREPTRKFQRVAVGVNADVDLIVPAVDLLKALKVSPGEKADHDELESLEQLQEVFATYFSRGSAAERYFANAVLFQDVVKTAKSLTEVESFVGGNAALMANKVASLLPEAKIQFVGPVGPVLETLLPQSVHVPPESKVKTDEYHLIMEYKVGDRWGDDIAPVATRFITSNDESNARASMLETFFASLSDFRPDLVLMSGLHMMEGLDKDTFSQRLQALVSGLDRVASHVPIHLELASMAKEDYLQAILERVPTSVSSIGLNEQELAFLTHVGLGESFTNTKQALPRVTSLGLNEQEIAFSALAGKGPHPELFKDQNGQPEIYKIGDMILWILKTFGYSRERTQSKLSRVHFHSLTYHIIGVLPAAWENTESAVVAGAHLAGRQACDVSNLSSDIVDIKIPLKFKLFSEDQERTFDSKKPVISWVRDGFHFTFSPVLVCKHPDKTVGLGDSISTAGLLHSQYTGLNKQDI